jgi:shikimate dehydrogenase
VLKAGVGAANLVLKKGMGLIAINTDVGAVVEPLRRQDFSGTSALLIGAGGAARAARAALGEVGVRRVDVMNRSPGRAQALLRSARLEGRAIPLGDAVPKVDLVLNATPLGMTGEPPLAINLGPLPSSAIVFDMVYDPVVTPLLQDARARGLRTIDGLAMLIEQAAASFERLFEAQPPRQDDTELRELLTQ